MRVFVSLAVVGVFVLFAATAWAGTSYWNWKYEEDGSGNLQFIIVAKNLDVAPVPRSQSTAKFRVKYQWADRTHQRGVGETTWTGVITLKPWEYGEMVVFTIPEGSAIVGGTAIVGVEWIPDDAPHCSQCYKYFHADFPGK